MTGNIEMSKEVSKILPALIKTQQEIPPMSKDKKNPHAQSEYLTLDKINETVLPIANKNDILVTQLPVERTDDGVQSIGVDTLLMHKSGEYVLYPAVYYQFEKGGRMNMTQSVGSIITYSKRYALTSIFGISTNEDNDGVQPEIRGQKSNKQKKWDQFNKNKQELVERVGKLASESMQPSSKVNETILARMNEESGDDDDKITPQNIANYNKMLRLAETRFSRHQAEQEQNKEQQQESKPKQNSFLQGSSTQVKENLDE